MELLTLLTVLFGAVCTTAIATPLVSRLAVAIGVVDRPSERTVSHRAGIPLLGGLAVGAGFGMGVYIATRLGAGPSNPDSLTGLLLGGAVMLAAGAYDDRYGLSALPKALLCSIAAIIAIASGYNIEYITDPISLTSTFLPVWLSWLVTLLWIVGITNALNLVDGLDGLASGVGIIIASTLTAIAWQVDQVFGVCIGVALSGALLGFLPYNFSPARIFLGDTGSLFAGYMLSLLALEGYRQVTLLTFVVPLLALAVPILDTAMSILRRIRRGAPVFAADRFHMHHRLLASEGSHRSAVLQFYFLTLAFCLIALSFTNLHGLTAGGFLVAVAILTLRLLRNLGVLTLDREEPIPDNVSGGEEKRS